jgi:hypothetical protein
MTWIFRLAWLYTGGKGQTAFSSSRLKVKVTSFCIIPHPIVEVIILSSHHQIMTSKLFIKQFPLDL